MKQLYLYILAVLCLYSCGRESTDKVINDICILTMQNEVTNQSTLETILGKPEVIYLSAKNDCYIGNINKVMEINDYIYVLSDFKQLLKYDKQGNNVFRIFKLGSGKGEYANIFDFDVYKNEIYVTTRTNKIIVYDAENGHFIRNITLDKDCSAIAVANSKLYCEAIAKGPAVNIYNLEGHSICTVGDNSKNPPVMSPAPFVKINDDHLGYTVFDMNDFTVIETQTDSNYISYIMSMNDALTVKIYDDIVTNHGKINEYGLIDVGDKADSYYCISSFRKCKNNVFIAFYRGNMNYFGLSNIRSSKNVVYNTSRVIDDRFGADVNMIIDNTSFCVSNKYTMTFIQPHDFVSEIAKVKYATSIAEGNPILLLFTL